MNEMVVSPGAIPRLTMGLHDVVTATGVLERNVPIPCVMVTAEADLANLPEYPAGSMAYTAGFAKIWQLSAAGTWVAVGGGE